MFRITRGMHVQHIHFPLPILDGDRDPLDEAEIPADRGDAPAAEDTAAPAVAREDASDGTGSSKPRPEQPA